MTELPEAPQRLPVRALIGAALGFIFITVALTVGIQLIGLERLREIIEESGPIAPLLYVFIRAVTNVIAPLNSGPLHFVAGAMFGLWEGLVLSLIAETLGGSINFWIARTLGRPVVARLVGRQGMTRVEKFYHQLGSPWVLIYARLFLFAAYDFISYGAGLTTLKFRDYVLITFFVGIPVAFVAVGIGTQLTGDPRQLIVLYLVLGVISLLTLLLYRYVRRWLRPPETSEGS